MPAFAPCPVCGQSVRVDNLSRHLARVHPRVASEARLPGPPAIKPSLTPLERQIRRRRVLATLLVATLLILGGVLTTLALNRPALPAPRIEVTPASQDLGPVAPEVVTATFRVRNAGEGDLTLTYLYTSCSCTTAVFRFQGQVSPVFGMHDNPGDWSLRLRPGEEGELRVSYDPNVHVPPDTGQISRAAYVRSNDPAQPEVQVTLTVYVVRG